MAVIDILALMKEELSKNYIVSEGEVTEDSASLTVSVGEEVFDVWYRDSKFGFPTQGNNIVEYDNFDDCKTYLDSYIWVMTKGISSAKKVADSFEGVVGANTVYDTFRGTMRDGYQFIFRVLGTEMEVIVQNETREVFCVKLVQYNDDRTKLRSLKKYKYAVSDGEVSLLWSFDRYFDELEKKYSGDYSVDISRLSSDSVKFGESDEGIAKITIEDNTLYFNFGQGIEFSVADPLDVESILQRYNELASGNGAEEPVEEVDKPVVEEPVSEDVEEPVSEGEISGLEEEPVEEVGESVSEEVEEPVVEEIKELEEEPVEEVVADDSNDTDEKSTSELIEEIVSGTLEGDMEVVRSMSDFEVAKLEIDGVGYVEFMNNGFVSRCPAESVENAGLPLSRIASTEKMVVQRGVYMSEFEVKCKSFASDVTDSDGIRGLINLLFS